MKFNDLTRNDESTSSHQWLTIGAIKIDCYESVPKIYFDNEKSVSITQAERSIIVLLAQNIGQVVSKQDLIVEAWGSSEYIGSNSLPVAITNLRKVLALANISITNVPRQGYLLEVPTATASCGGSFQPDMSSLLKQHHRSVTVLWFSSSVHITLCIFTLALFAFFGFSETFFVIIDPPLSELLPNDDIQ